MHARTISRNEKKGTAMVVIIQPDANNKPHNISETRHLKYSGGRWTDGDNNVFVPDGNGFTTGAE